jgi:dTDP-4-dehydrorhamnose reductase
VHPSSKELLSGAAALEVWGGVECTVNRVGDRYFDQIARSGHARRLDDLDRFADLGIRALRFPMLWEHMQPERDGEPDWRWADRALERLRERGVRPIIGLLHHGFGPRWADPRDPDFATHFARYARTVANRYPWVDAYTPVNEPLTTARFAGLYGHWHPHGRDDATFVRLFLAQLDATARAMRQIRLVNPKAILIQTEDLGKVASTAALESQRDFENERRWLTWDMLSGTVTRSHGCWEYLCNTGERVEGELAAFADAPCPPDIIGLNHYLTSERFLDERVERYALDEIGGNGREVYADVAQVQVQPHRRAGIEGLLRETWERYRSPIAVTEVHVGCTREEQMRWLQEVWQAGVKARAVGIDVRAITSWALLGSFDWNSLVTRETDYYEPGVFDVRAPVPRPTALAAMVSALARHGRYEHPVLATRGWWHRGVAQQAAHAHEHGDVRPILIVRSADALDRALAEACDRRGLAHRLVDGEEIELTTRDGVEGALDALRPWAVIADAAFSELLADECLRRGVACLRIARDATEPHAMLDLLLDEEHELASASASALGIAGG